MAAAAQGAAARAAATARAAASSHTGPHSSGTTHLRRAHSSVCSAAGRLALRAPGAAVCAPGRLGAVLQQAAAEEARRAGRRRVHPAPVLRSEQPHLRRQAGQLAPWRSTPGCSSDAVQPCQERAEEHLEQDWLPGVKARKVGGPVRASRLWPGTDLIWFASGVSAHALRMHPEPESVMYQSQRCVTALTPAAAHSQSLARASHTFSDACYPTRAQLLTDAAGKTQYRLSFLLLHPLPRH